tara:strand:+ start:2587 stop:5013 length:2427 start_codon:yes stop_codon:yes gene_type:complete
MSNKYTKHYLDNKYPNDNGFDLWSKGLKIGKNLECAIKNIGIDDEASKERQIAKALEVLSCCNPSHEAMGVKRTGLVVGKVQSGKTTSFALLAAAAADNDYKLIINLLGTNNNLFESNLVDVQKILGTENNSNWEIRKINSRTKGGINIDENNLKNLLRGNPASRVKSDNKVIYMPLLKNVHSIGPLKDLLLKVNFDNEKHVKVLIIDDEVDTYGIDIGNSKKSPTNVLINELRDACGICTYVGYTATSAAVELALPNNFMSPDFHSLLYPGKGYVGNSDLFGHPKRVLNENDYNKYQFNPQIKELKNMTITDVNGDEIDDKKRLTDTMIDAVCYFLVSANILRDRLAITDPEDDRRLSMMLHPTRSTGLQGAKPGELNHDEVMDKLAHFLDHVLWADLSNNASSSDSYHRLKIAYDDLHKNCSKDQLSKFPKFVNVIEHIKNMVNPNNYSGKTYSIQLCNQSTPPTIEWGNSELWFLIGGNKLSRGFVVKGLLTTWMPVEPKNIIADTMEQRGRFFGYKADFIDLIRVFLKEKTMKSFRDYQIWEIEQWEKYENARKKGIALRDTDVFLTAIDSLHALTSSSKSKRRVNTIRSSWISAKHLPFQTFKGTVFPNHQYQVTTEIFLKAITGNLKSISQPNKWNARASGQVFKYASLALDKVYEHYLSKLLKPTIGLTAEEENFKSAIKYIKTLLIGKGHICDVVIFDSTGPKFKGSELTLNPENNQWGWTNTGYTSGARASARFLDPKKDYCGDNSIILGKDFDPYLEGIDFDKNYNVTIQIHKKKVYEDTNDSNTLPSIYGIRIKLPH